MKEQENLLQQVTERLKFDVIHSMQSNGRYATGKTIAGLETSTTDSKSLLLGPDYIDILESGRQPTRKGAPASEPNLLSRIKEWCAAKGIDERAAWPITQKIHREGYEGKPGVLTEPLSGENVNRRVNEVMEQLAQLVQTEIADSLMI